MNVLSLLATVPAWRGDALSAVVETYSCSVDDLVFLREERLVDDVGLWVEGDGLRIGVAGEGSAGLGHWPLGTVGCSNGSVGPDTIDELRRCLQVRLRAYRRWLHALHGVNRGAEPDLNALLAVAFDLIGHSLVLFDGSFDFLAYAGDDLPRSTALARTIEQGYAMGVSVEHQRAYRRLQAEHPEGFATWFREGERLTPVWARTVRTCQGRSCQLHVMGLPTGAQAPGGEDAGSGAALGLLGVRSLVDDAVDELRLMLERLGPQGIAHLSDDLVQALVTRVVDPGEARDRARFFGWDTDGGYQVVRVQSTGEEFATSRLGCCARELCGRLAGAHASVMDGGVTLLVPLVDGLEGVLGGYLVAEGLAAGLSDARYDLTEAPAAYDEACVAAGRALAEAQACGGLSPRGCAAVRTYESCKASLLAEELARGLGRRNLVPACLGAMRAHDAARGSSYADTLMAYVRCRGSKVETCERLAIHRSTLDYRLERLGELFGIDLADDRLWRWLTVVDVGEAGM